VSLSLKGSPGIVYTAPWVIPIQGDILRDGAIAVRHGLILSLGSIPGLLQRYPEFHIVSYPGVFLPELVNSHIHLDLSCYGTVPVGKDNFSMCDWIRALLEKRMDMHFSYEEKYNAARKQVLKQFDAGVGLLLDIGNQKLASYNSIDIKIISLLEMLGPTDAAGKSIMASLAALGKDIAITGHAPYSTVAPLLQDIKKRAGKLETIFSLHVAENCDEAKLLFEGTGCFYEFLKERDALDKSFPIRTVACSSVVEYLSKLDLLDSNSICVHCVHVSREDIQILAKSGSHICLCPSSNAFLKVGRAPLDSFIDAGILPALGTDSITSNPDLDMWQEMAILRQNYPDVSAVTILEMATIAGAMALKSEQDYGTLRTGQKARFIHVDDPAFASVASEDQIIAQLTGGGRPQCIERPCDAE